MKRLRRPLLSLALLAGTGLAGGSWQLAAPPVGETVPPDCPPAG